MEKTLRIVEKLIPKKIYHFFQPAYHYFMALLGAIVYSFPAKKLYIVAVTGTKGKTSTTEMINAILEHAGKKTALSNGIRFKIDNKIRLNKFKMSMPGRFFMQKFLSDAVHAGCTHAIVEMTSEGSKMFRHKFIWADAFIFTNLAPEHIESHGSYTKYLEAKLNLVDSLDSSKKKNTILIVNGDDEEAEHFLEKPADKKISYSLSNAKPLDLTNGVQMRFDKITLYSPLPGEFNAYNILAAATFAREIGIADSIIKEAIENLTEIPGRAQKIEAGQNFGVYVDYAHTKESLEALYKAFPNKNKVCVLGNTGGGRDKWKRPEMAKIAEKYCDEIILTDEDPYDENPKKIVDEMKAAITEKPAEIIMDRRTAINKAISKAVKINKSKNEGKIKNDTIVLITGKGTDPYIMGPAGTKTPWSDADVAKEEIKKVLADR